MWRVSRTRRQLLRSQRKGRVESRSWLLPTDRLRRRRFAFGQSGGPGFHNANHIQVVGRMIDLGSDEAIVAAE